MKKFILRNLAFQKFLFWYWILAYLQNDNFHSTEKNFKLYFSPSGTCYCSSFFKRLANMTALSVVGID